MLKMILNVKCKFIKIELVKSPTFQKKTVQIYILFDKEYDHLLSFQANIRKDWIFTIEAMTHVLDILRLAFLYSVKYSQKGQLILMWTHLNYQSSQSFANILQRLCCWHLYFLPHIKSKNHALDWNPKWISIEIIFL